MRTINVRDATGRALDWLVGVVTDGGPSRMLWRLIQTGNWKPSTNHAHGGPIFDEHRVSRIEKHDGWWRACIYDINDDAQHLVLGPTSLIAAARCLVLSQLGDEVEVPEELL